MQQVVIELAYAAAYTIRKRWPMASLEDIRQEILLYALEEGITGEELEELEPQERTQAEKDIRRGMLRAGERYGRREKAQQSGYQVDDEQFYSLSRLKELLVAFYCYGLTEHPPSRGPELVRAGGTDGSEAGTWISSLLDVQRGLALLSESQRWRLERRYSLYPHLTDAEFASRTYVSEDTARTRTRAALRALQRALGGANPWQRGPALRTAERPAEV